MKNRNFQLNVNAETLASLLNDKTLFASGIIFALDNHHQISNFKYNIEDKIVIIYKLQHITLSYQFRDNQICFQSLIYFGKRSVEVPFNINLKIDDEKIITNIEFNNEYDQLVDNSAIREFMKNFETFARINQAEQEQIAENIREHQQLNHSIEYTLTRNHTATFAYILVCVFLTIFSIYGLLITPDAKMFELKYLFPNIVRIILSIVFIFLLLKRYLYLKKLTNKAKNLNIN